MSPDLAGYKAIALFATDVDYDSFAETKQWTIHAFWRAIFVLDVCPSVHVSNAGIISNYRLYLQL